jgi:hypothetical protein
MHRRWKLLLNVGNMNNMDWLCSKERLLGQFSNSQLLLILLNIYGNG